MRFIGDESKDYFVLEDISEGVVIISKNDYLNLVNSVDNLSKTSNNLVNTIRTLNTELKKKEQEISRLNAFLEANFKDEYSDEAVDKLPYI